MSTEKEIEWDESKCFGCGEPLLAANAWMEDGCPCNTAAGVNAGNELISEWRNNGWQKARHELEAHKHCLSCIDSCLERAGGKMGESNRGEVIDGLVKERDALTAKLAEAEKRIAELANRCLAVRDQVNKYHRSKLQCDLDELDRLVGQCNTPDLIHDLEKMRDELHAEEVSKWRKGFERECDARRTAESQLAAQERELAELRGERKELAEGLLSLADFAQDRGVFILDEAKELVRKARAAARQGQERGDGVH